LALLAITGARAAERPPNIVIILADDLGYGDLACYGSPKNRTPHLDRMAAEGAKLTHFNCPMAYCAPTRASLLTGRYPFRCGMTQNPAPDGGPDADGLHLPESEVTLAQVLKQAGYATGMIGKWHLGHAKPEWMPTQRGFNEYFGIPYSNDMRPVQVVDAETRVEYPVVQATLTKRYTARAADFIERNKARPFWPGKIPAERVIDGRDILPVFQSDVASPHAVIFGQQSAKLATARDARWKLHVLKPGAGLVARYKPGDHSTDPRAPDGVTILAPYEQATPDQLPGVQTGDAPGPMQLFDLIADPAEQHDVAAQHGDVVERLKKAYDDMNAQPREHPVQSTERKKPNP